MRTPLDEADVGELLDRAAPDPEVARRIESARLLGADLDLGAPGMVSVSLKCDTRGGALLLQTPAGAALERLTRSQLCLLDLAAVRALCEPGAQTAAVERALRRAQLDCDLAPVSPDALLHAAVPARSVEQSYPTAVLALACQPDAGPRLRASLGSRVAWIPWSASPAAAARAVGEVCEKHRDLEAIVLEGRGLLSFGEDTGESVERARRIARRAEEHLLERIANTGRMLDARPVVAMRDAGEVAPVLRGALAAPTGDLDRPFVHVVLAFRSSDEIAHFASAPITPLLAAATPPTQAHARLAGGPWLFVPTPPYADLRKLHDTLRSEVEVYRRASIAALERGSADEIGPLDATPRAVLLPGMGLFGVGETGAQARAAAAAAEHAIRVKIRAATLGQYEGMPESGLPSPASPGVQPPPPLRGQVALVAGAGECARAASCALRSAGAEVLCAGGDPGRAEADAGERLEVELHDALDARDVLRAAAERAGGVDVAVLDADALGIETARALVEKALALLGAQGTGGAIVLVSRQVDVTDLCRDAARRGGPGNVRVNALRLGVGGGVLRMPASADHAARAAVFLAQRDLPLSALVLPIGGET